MSLNSKPRTLYPRRNGFTFIEIILVLAISISLTALFFGGLARQNADHDLELVTVSLISFLRDAQERARGQESGTSWGVYFNNPSSGKDSYALFSGDMFSSASSTIHLPSTVVFSDPASGESTEVVFQKVTGAPTSTLTVTLQLVRDASVSQNVVIHENGSIMY